MWPDGGFAAACRLRLVRRAPEEVSMDSVGSDVMCVASEAHHDAVMPSSEPVVLDSTGHIAPV